MYEPSNIVLRETCELVVILTVIVAVMIGVQVIEGCRYIILYVHAFVLEHSNYSILRFDG